MKKLISLLCLSVVNLCFAQSVATPVAGNPWLPDQDNQRFITCQTANGVVFVYQGNSCPAGTYIKNN